MLNSNSHQLKNTQQVLNQIIDNPNLPTLPVTNANLKQLLKKHLSDPSMTTPTFKFIQQHYLSKLFNNHDILMALARQIQTLAQQQLQKNTLYPFNQIEILSRAGDELAFVGHDDYYYHFTPHDMESFNPYDYLTYQDLYDEFNIFYNQLNKVDDDIVH